MRATSTAGGSSALVTGGSSGIGAAVVGRLVEHGCRVAVADLKEGPGSTAAASAGGCFVATDVTEPRAVRRAVEVAAGLGDLRHVVTSAAVGYTERTVSTDGGPHSLEAFQRILQTNLVGTFDVVRQAAATMASNAVDPSGERGSFVLLSSVEAYDGQAGQVAYAAAKAAIAGMALPLARDLADLAIRVNVVAPGFIDSPMYGEGDEATRFKSILGDTVLFPRRMGRPGEVADLVIACLRSTYLNAASIRVDGGVRLSPELPARPHRRR